MASRHGMLLTETDRRSLIEELHFNGDLRKTASLPQHIVEYTKKLPATDPSGKAGSYGTGCLACGEDDDHANLLLCEGCNAEYHTYCLDPPLRSVPMGDFYCTACKIPTFVNDDLENRVHALPPSFTSRFGDIVWAQGGVGFGWWPSVVYDPRLTVGNARQLAKKNLGKRHLVYFFECLDAPFAVLPTAKLESWQDGIIQGYHLGKTARASGRVRTELFQQAIQAASVEAGKPIEMRMDWNHTDQPQILPTPKIIKPSRRAIEKMRKERQRMKEEARKKGSKKKRVIRGFALLGDEEEESTKVSTPVRRNLSHAIDALAAAASRDYPAEESTEVSELCCKILMNKGTSENTDQLANIGFVKLRSTKTATFADIRGAIEKELVPEVLDPNLHWKFLISTLGPVSRTQEKTLGSALSLICLSDKEGIMGKGTAAFPLQVTIAPI